MEDKFVLSTDPSEKDKFYACHVDFEGDVFSREPHLETCTIRQIRFGKNKDTLYLIKDRDNYTVIEGGIRNGRYGRIDSLNRENETFTVVYTETVPWKEIVIKYGQEYIPFCDYVTKIESEERERCRLENLRTTCIKFCTGQQDLDLLSSYNVEHTVVECEQGKVHIPRYLMKYFVQPNPLDFDTTNNIGHSPHRISAGHMKTVVDLLLLCALRQGEAFYQLLRNSIKRLDDYVYICGYFNIEVLLKFLSSL